MSRMKFLMPAAALMLAGAVMTSTAQAAPVSGMAEGVKAAQTEVGGDVEKANWRHRRHRHYYHHHWRRHHHHHHHHRWHRHHRHYR